MPGASPQNKIKFFIPNGRWSKLPKPHRSFRGFRRSPDVEHVSRILAVFGVSPTIEYTFVL
jgi:hypothetical protein